jgi:uncharacterized protein (TIGR03437 family)
MKKLFLVMVCTISVLASLSGQPRRAVQAAKNEAKIAANGSVAASASPRLQQTYAKLPLRFEANQGQVDNPVKFLARGQGYSLFLTQTGAVLRLQTPSCAASEPCQPSGSTLHMNLVGAQAGAQIEGRGKLVGNSNYLLGANPQRWRANVLNYERVEYQNIYPGIDAIYYGNQQQLEYDFMVAPHANPNVIKLQFQGAQTVRLDKNGDLLLHLDGTEVRLRKPVAYQWINGKRRVIAANYRLESRHQVRFRLGAYHRNRPLVIDPVLVYGTFWGGLNQDSGFGVAVDHNGNAYITGATSSSDLPGTNPVQSANAGLSDTFVLKLSADGATVLYATYLGGSQSDFANAIAVDVAGNAYLAGVTNSKDFPITAGALRTTMTDIGDAFVAKLNPAGTALVYSTYLGGNGVDRANAIAVDAQGHAYVTGQTDSFDLPTSGLATVRSGSSVFKSTNGGNLWNSSATGYIGTGAQTFVFDPTNPNIVYATTPISVFKSTDGATNWSVLWNAPSAAATITGINVDPASAATIYVSTLGGVYKSTNGGTSFVLKNTGLQITSVNALAIDPVTPSILYAATTQGVFKTTNGGDNWTAINTGLTDGIINTAYFARRLAIDPTTPTTIYAGTQRGVFKSTDGGANWNFTSFSLPAQDIFSLAIHPTIPNTLYVGINSTTGTFYRSTNGGATFDLYDHGLREPINGIRFILAPQVILVNPVTGSLYIGTTQGVFTTVKETGNWVRVQNGLTSLQVTALAAVPNTSDTLLAGANIGSDGFAAKLNPTGSALLYSLYLGGTDLDAALGIALDRQGNAWVAGRTLSTNFPLMNPLQSTYGGVTDAFVTKINAAGSALFFSSYLGGRVPDEVRAIAVDSEGNAYVGGQTQSTDFPVVNAFKPTFQPSATGFQDGFLTKVKADGSAWVYSTYFGGIGNDQVLGLAVDQQNHLWVTGLTTSADFPAVGAFQALSGINNQDAFVSQVANTGTGILFSTFLGGIGNDQGNALAVDRAGSVYVVGTTFSNNFPVNNPRLTFKGNSDAFLAKIGSQSDVGLGLADSPDPVMVNQELTYTVSITNHGPDTAKEVVVTDTLPAGVTLKTATASAGSCTGSATVTCALGDLVANAKATVTIIVAPKQTGTIRNSATVTTSTSDANAANNLATVETNVGTTPSIFGRVRLGNGEGVGQVAVALSGGKMAAATTNAEGFYQFAELPTAVNYAITPSRTGYVFNPPNRTVTNLTTDQVADFQAVQCSFDLFPDKQTFAATGGTGTITLLTNDVQCSWTARSTVPWITMTAPLSGAGNAAILFKVAATTIARSGKIIIGNRTFTIWQEHQPCAQPEFALPLTYPLNNISGRYIAPPFAAADFNGDSRPDVAFALEEINVGQGLAIALRNSSGGLNPQTKILSAGSEYFAALVAADVNADSKMDLLLSATSNVTGTGQLVVLLGDGAGGFASPARYSITKAASEIRINDFNSDGRPDVVMGSGRSVTVLLNTGGGVFGNPKETDVSDFLTAVSQLTTADFNRDGKADVAVISDLQKCVVLFGDAAGGFGSRRNMDLPLFTTNVLAEDLNGDGKADLVFGGNDTLSLWPGNGDGAFGTSVNYKVGQPVFSFVAADVNQDGKRDLAAATANGIAFLFADGNGGFLPAVSWLNSVISDQSVSRTALTIADWNRDGILDVLTTGLIGSGESKTSALSASIGLSVLAGKGQGQFNASRGFSFLDAYGNANAPELVTGDLNGDETLDLAIAYGANQVAILFGRGNGEFSAPTTYEVGEVPKNITLADFNRDGNLDVMVLNHNSASVSLLRNNGRGVFTVTTPLTTKINPRTLVISDFNNDGLLDVVINSVAGGLGLRIGNGSGEFTETVTGLAGASTGFTNPVAKAGDFNGDGNTDLAIVNPQLFNDSNDCAPLSNIFLLLLGDGKGAFSTALNTTLTEKPRAVQVGDLNGDGRDDLIYSLNCSLSEGLYVRLADANGGFQPAVRYALGAAAVNSTQASVGDLNGDGRLDVIVSNTNSGNLSVLLGKGDGSLQAPFLLPLASKPATVVFGDFNTDGKSDLALTRGESGNVAILLNQASCLAPNSAVTVSGATYSSIHLSQNSIASAFGVGFATTTQTATNLPLPTSLGGTTVQVTDSSGTNHQAALFYVSPQQVNYQLPAGLAAGTALVTITSGNGQVSTGTIAVANVSPGLFTANQNGSGAAAATILYFRNGTPHYESNFRCNAQGQSCTARPIDLTAGDDVFLELYGTGIRNNSGLTNVTVTVGGVAVPVLYASKQPDFIGLDQVNIQLPKTLAGRGEVDMVLTVDGKAANPVNIHLK